MFYNRHKVATVTLLISSTNALAVLPAQLLNNHSLILSPSSSSTSSHANGTSNLTLTGHQSSTTCDENLYGQTNVKSCLNLYTSLSDDDTIIEFRDRARGFSEYTLPYRFISERVTDGKCVLDVEAQSGFHADKATMSQISAATMQLLNICVLPEGSGGKLKGLGEKGGLSLTIEEYTPDVVCQQEMSRYNDRDVHACRELLTMMPASEDLQMFGKKGDPGVQVELPFDLAIPGGNCGFFINTNSGPQKLNWHNLWQSATAIWGICGRKQQQGIAFTGNKGSITVAMYRPSDDLPTLKREGNRTSNTVK